MRKELGEKGLDGTVASTLLEGLAGAPPADLAAWMGQQMALLNEEGKAGIEDLRQIFALCESTSAGPHLSLDRSLARGLSYYTGRVRDSRADLLVAWRGVLRQLVGMFLGENRAGQRNIGWAGSASCGWWGPIATMFPKPMVSTPADVRWCSGARTHQSYLSLADGVAQPGPGLARRASSGTQTRQGVKKVPGQAIQVRPARGGIPYVRAGFWGRRNWENPDTVTQPKEYEKRGKAG